MHSPDLPRICKPCFAPQSSPAIIKIIIRDRTSPLEELKEGLHFRLVHWLYNVPRPLERAQTVHYGMQVLTAGISHRG